MLKSLLKKSIIVPLLAAIVLSSFALGFFTGQTTVPSIQKIKSVINQDEGNPNAVDFSLFWDAWRLVEEKYVGRQDLDYQKMLYGAISGMIKGVGDPYTVFMDPEENKQFMEGMTGEFEGIGAELGMRNDILTVIAPLEGTPAQKAGLKSGDKIVKINDKLTSDLSVDEAVVLIRGAKGTEVSLTVMRDEWPDPREIKIVRGTIKIPVIDFKVVDNIAQIKLYEFNQNSADEFGKVAQKIISQRDNKVKGVVLDMRNNPGGYLDLSVDIAGWFLPAGHVVAIEDYGNGKKNQYRTSGTGSLKNIPLVVLINQGSASAAEILAGALRDDRQVQLIGEKSFGKGSVQQLQDLLGGSSLKVTVAKWLTPSGKSIQDQGLEPDVEVGFTEEDVKAGRDPQMERAMEIVKGL